MHRAVNQWLHTTSFLKKTRFIKNNIIFVLETAGIDGKGATAARLGLCYFVDDKIECLNSVFSDQCGNCGNLIRGCHGGLIHFGSQQWRQPPVVDTHMNDLCTWTAGARWWRCSQRLASSRPNNLESAAAHTSAGPY